MKRFLTFGILIVVLAGIFVPNVAFGQLESLAAVGANVGATVAQKATLNSWGDALFGGIARGIGGFLMAISALVLTFTGLLFDWVVQFSIIDMAKNIGDPKGVGGSITQAWATLRDIANMAFIFVLLYTAFKAMFELDFGNVGKTIMNIIIVALLINFSLFFSKVVIDASNIVSVGFYNSITSANVGAIGGSAAASGQKTISSGYMRLLGLQKWNDTSVFQTNSNMTPQTILLVGIMSSIFMLVTAVIMLISGVMFAARFIILIFLMVLSPLALISYAIPGLNKYFKEWGDALLNQSFFAPLFFALTWVVFKIASTPGFLGQMAANSSADASYIEATLKSPNTFFAVILNYVLVIGFAIAALVFAKSMASKTAGFTVITKGIGTGVVGGAALAGRNTIGRASKYISEEKREKWSQSRLGRAGLWAANQGKSGSFDIRSSETIKKVPGLGKEMDILGKGGGKGGFAKAVDDKAKAKATYAKDVYGQTDAEKEKAGKEEETYKKENAKYEEVKKTEEEKIRAERKTERVEAEQIKKDAEEDFKKKTAEAERAKSDRIAGIGNSADEERAKKEMGESRLRLQNITNAHKQAIEREKAKIEETDYTEATRTLKTEAEARKQAWEKVKNAGTERQKAYADRVESGPFGWGAGSKAAARKIRDQAKGKSKKERLADLAKEVAKEDEETAAPTPPPAPAGGETPPGATS